MWNLNFETITPLHISNGNQLAYNLEYVVSNSKISKFNISRVSKVLAKAKLFDFSKNYNSLEIIKIIDDNKHLFDKELFEYQVFIENSFGDYLENENRVGKKIIQEFINANGSFYIPGSSIKGMLTTILNRDPKKNPLGINPNNPSIKDKFVITDSEYLDEVFFGVETVQRPPSINLITLGRRSEFNSKIIRKGNLGINNLRESLSKYSFLQLDKAKKIVSKFKEKEKKPAGAANYYNIIEKMINEIKLEDDEYLVNLGFGGGSYYKIYSNAAIPTFPSKRQRNSREEAHTTFTANIDNELYQLGWCKLKIEEE